MGEFNIQLPPRFVFSGGSQEEKDEQLEEYLFRMANIIEESLRQVFGKGTEKVDTPVSGNLVSLDEDGGIADSGISANIGWYTNTDVATITFSMTTYARHRVVLGGNRTLAVSNVSVGQVFIIKLVQDGAGSRTVTWWGGISWVDAVVPTLTVTLNKADFFIFICTGTNTYDGFTVGMNL